MTLVIEGSWEEIKARESEFAGHRLRVIVEAETDERINNLPPPPFAVRDQDHLEELMLESLGGPLYEVTEETWEERFKRIDDHDRSTKRA